MPVRCVLPATLSRLHCWLANSHMKVKADRNCRTGSSGAVEDASDEEPNMKKPLSVCVVCLFIGMTAMTMSGSHDRDAGVRGRLVGSWRLGRPRQRGMGAAVH